jgi:hypothetical protein
MISLIVCSTAKTEVVFHKAPEFHLRLIAIESDEASNETPFFIWQDLESKCFCNCAN